LTDLNEVKQYIHQEWCKYNTCTQHYERLYQIIDVLKVLSDNRIAGYKKLDEAKEQQHKKQEEVEQQQEVGSAPHDTDKDERKRKAL
jgi:hypothetical protein